MIVSKAFINKIWSAYLSQQRYMQWIRHEERNTPGAEELSRKPLISVVVPVYNVKPGILRACINSVIKQTYTAWELILVDDHSTLKSVQKTLDSFNSNDRIHIIYRKTNGHISRCTNTGIKQARGEFVAFMDCDDTLSENALYEVARVLNSAPDTDYIYSDEDMLTEHLGIRKKPFFKPDWSPDTFMSMMYTCHFSVFRRSLLEEMKGLRVGYEGSQDYDLILRLMEHTRRIAHIPKILYHWRESRGSTAKTLSSKPYVLDTTVQTKEDALKRRKQPGYTSWVKKARQYRVVYEPLGESKVSIITSSDRIIDDIQAVTAYKNYDITVAGDDTSASYNLAAGNTDGEFLLFLDGKIQIKDPDWLSHMLGHCRLKHTGAVGCKLYYPDKIHILHTGILNLPSGPIPALHRFDDRDRDIYFSRNLVEYNYSAVSGGCLMVERKKFDSIGGFEETLPRYYSDVELCFKLLDAGYYNVVRNDVVLTYNYTCFYPRKRDRRSLKKLYELHPQRKGIDPFYNINLSRKHGDFSISIPYNRRHL